MLDVMLLAYMKEMWFLWLHVYVKFGTWMYSNGEPSKSIDQLKNGEIAHNLQSLQKCPFSYVVAKKYKFHLAILLISFRLVFINYYNPLSNSENVFFR